MGISTHLGDVLENDGHLVSRDDNVINIPDTPKSISASTSTGQFEKLGFKLSRQHIANSRTEEVIFDVNHNVFDDDHESIFEEHTDPEGHLKDPDNFSHMKDTIGQLFGTNSSNFSLTKSKFDTDGSNIDNFRFDEVVPSLLTFGINYNTLSILTYPIIPKPLSVNDIPISYYHYRCLINRFKNIEMIICQMQHPSIGIENKPHKKRFKTSYNVVSGQQIVAWLALNKSDFDKEEHIDICNYLFNLGYIMSINYKDKFIPDASLYIFQIHLFWPSAILFTRTEDYASYLLRRSWSTDVRNVLDEDEEETLCSLLEEYGSVWDRVTDNAKKSKSILSNIKKDDLWRFIQQEHTFWSLRYSKKPTKFIDIVNNNVKRFFENNDKNIDDILSPAKLLDWYEKTNRSYTYQLNTRYSHPVDSARYLYKRVILATYIDSFISPAVGFKKIWYSLPNSTIPIESCIPEKIIIQPIWKLSLQELLRSPSGIREFYKFLDSEYSTENLSFYLECKELEKIFYYKAFSEKAISIFEEFIIPGAPKEINIPANLRNSVTIAVSDYIHKNIEIKRNIFDSSVCHVLKLMTTDSYVRFCSSDTQKDR